MDRLIRNQGFYKGDNLCFVLLIQSEYGELFSVVRLHGKEGCLDDYRVEQTDVANELGAATDLFVEHIQEVEKMDYTRVDILTPVWPEGFRFTGKYPYLSEVIAPLPERIVSLSSADYAYVPCSALALNVWPLATDSPVKLTAEQVANSREYGVMVLPPGQQVIIDALSPGMQMFLSEENRWVPVPDIFQTALASLPGCVIDAIYTPDTLYLFDLQYEVRNLLGEVKDRRIEAFKWRHKALSNLIDYNCISSPAIRVPHLSLVTKEKQRMLTTSHATICFIDETYGRLAARGVVLEESKDAYALAA